MRALKRNIKLIEVDNFQELLPSLIDGIIEDDEEGRAVD